MQTFSELQRAVFVQFLTRRECVAQNKKEQNFPAWRSVQQTSLTPIILCATWVCHTSSITFECWKVNRCGMVHFSEHYSVLFDSMDSALWIQSSNRSQHLQHFPLNTFCSNQQSLKRPLWPPACQKPHGTDWCGYGVMKNSVQVGRRPAASIRTLSSEAQK